MYIALRTRSCLCLQCNKGKQNWLFYLINVPFFYLPFYGVNTFHSLKKSTLNRCLEAQTHSQPLACPPLPALCLVFWSPFWLWILLTQVAFLFAKDKECCAHFTKLAMNISDNWILKNMISSSPFFLCFGSFFFFPNPCSFPEFNPLLRVFTDLP